MGAERGRWAAASSVGTVPPHGRDGALVVGPWRALSSSRCHATGEPHEARPTDRAKADDGETTGHAGEPSRQRKNDEAVPQNPRCWVSCDKASPAVAVVVSISKS